jgi:deoxycytidylate deaminase
MPSVTPLLSLLVMVLHWNLEMHVTHAPCLNCARMIINAGIAKVTYRVPYRLNDGVELLTQGGVEVVEYHGDSA